MTSHQEAITALAEASRIPEPVAAAALAIEESRQFRDAFQPVLDGTLHPAAIVFARIAREHDHDVRLTEQDLFLIAEARRLAPALKASISDRDRHAGWLLADLADLADRLDAACEHQRTRTEALDAYAQQNADVHRENMRLLDEIARLEGRV